MGSSNLGKYHKSLAQLINNRTNGDASQRTIIFETSKTEINNKKIKHQIQK